jgi:hypothetical protein
MATSATHSHSDTPDDAEVVAVTAVPLALFYPLTAITLLL